VRRASALLLVAAASVQFGAAFAVRAFDRLGPGGMVLLRLSFAALILLAIWRPRVRGRSWADLRLAIAFGVVLGLMNWSFYQALGRIKLGPTVTLEFLGPMTVAVLGTRRLLDLAWVVLAAAGVVVLANPFGGGGGLDAIGVVLALGAGTCWAVYILLSARTGRAWPGASGLAFGMGFGALVALPAGVVQGGSHLLEPAMLGVGLVVGLASSVIPYTLEMEALRTLPEGVFGVMMSLDPALAALAGFVVLGQSLSAADVAAICCVVVASAGAAATAARARRLPSTGCPPSPTVTAA
jgi:inner membrane transporter RhtA